MVGIPLKPFYRNDRNEVKNNESNNNNHHSNKDDNHNNNKDNNIKNNHNKTKLLIYDPLSPIPTVGGTGIGFLTAGPQNQYPIEHLVDETSLLTYTSPVFTKDMVVVGYPVLHVTMRCLSPGIHLFIHYCYYY